MFSPFLIVHIFATNQLNDDVSLDAPCKESAIPFVVIRSDGWNSSSLQWIYILISSATRERGLADTSFPLSCLPGSISYFVQFQIGIDERG